MSITIELNNTLNDLCNAINEAISQIMNTVLKITENLLAVIEDIIYSCIDASTFPNQEHEALPANCKISYHKLIAFIKNEVSTFKKSPICYIASLLGILSFFNIDLHKICNNCVNLHKIAIHFITSYF